MGDIVEAYENDNGDVETVVVSRYTVAKIDKVDTDVSTAESRNGASEVLTLTDLDGDNSNDYYDKYDDAEKTLRGYASSYDEGTVLAVAFRDGKFGDEVLASYEAEAVTGEVTAFREDETVTMDGTKYEFARNENGHRWFRGRHHQQLRLRQGVHHLPDRRRLCHRCGGCRWCRT